MFMIVNDLGDIHNGVHVLWFIEAVPEADEAEREKITTAGLETMVYTNFIRLKVSPVLIEIFWHIMRNR